MYVERVTGRNALLLLTHTLVLTSSYGLFTNLQVLNGNLTITGIFGIQTSGSGGECGDIQVASVMTMEAIRWYIQSVNENDTQPLKLGFSVYKTCGNSGRAGDAAVDIISRYRRSIATDVPEDLIIGVIGPESSSETRIVSSILGSQTTSDRLLQIGFSSTSTKLNDRAKYPNYYRVVVDDEVQITALLQMMLDLKWNRIAIMYVNDIYGRECANMLQKYATGKYEICISRTDSIDIDENNQVEAAQIRDILDGYVTKIPSIEGVVYFGNMAIAKKVMQIFEAIRMTDVPMFILLESNLATDVFQSATGNVLSKTKGTLALSKPFIEVPDFKRYWDSLFTSKSALQTASEANPYLKDVFKKYKGCDFNSASCDALNGEEVKEKVVQSVDVHYAIYAAQTLIKALKRFYNRTCNSGCNTTNEFKANFQPYLLIEAMDGLSVTYGGIQASFKNDSSKIHFADGVKEYEVYNFRQDPADTSKFTFINVGNLSDGHLFLETNKIKDYGPSGLERSYPNVRRGQCPTNQKCAECFDSDSTEINYHITGDFYVIGLVSIHNQAIPGPLGCGTFRKRHGYQMLLSLQFALNEFKTRRWYARYKEMFAGKSIGLIVINSCNNALEVVPKILQLHSKGLRLPDGTHLDLTNRILGYVGGQAADVSEPAATQLTKLGIVQISYTSTNPVLSNKELYPYFLRLITPDNVQAKAMIDIVKDLGGEYIQLVYSEGAYGEGVRDAVLAAASTEKVCVSQTIMIKESFLYYEYYEMLRTKPHAKIVLILLRSHVVGPFLRDLSRNMERGEFQFIGSEAWGKNAKVLEYDITQGAILMAVEMDKNRDLEEFIKRQKPHFNVSNPWLEDYIQSRQDCYYSWSYDKTFSRECTDDILPISNPNFESDPWCIFVTNTMLAFLKGAAIFYSNQCGSSASSQLCDDFVQKPEEFFKALINVKMDIYGTGEILIFDENGDGLMGYKIYNIQAGQEDRTTREYIQVGSYNTRGGLKYVKENIQYPKADPILSTCPSQLACAACLRNDSTNDQMQSNIKDQSKEVVVLGSFVGILAVVVAIQSVVFIIMWLRKRNTPDDPYITPTYRPAADGGHMQNATHYVTANPLFEHD